jgi:hypothetical protein
MKPTRDAVLMLSDEVVARVVQLIRSDPVLGRGSCSSWDEVAPSDFETGERVRTLIDEGFVTLGADRTPAGIVRAFRAVEPTFWGTGSN